MDEDPSQLAKGVDPQLERAIQEVLQRIKDQKPVAPRPTYERERRRSRGCGIRRRERRGTDVTRPAGRRIAADDLRRSRPSRVAVSPSPVSYEQEHDADSGGAGAFTSGPTGVSAPFWSLMRKTASVSLSWLAAISQWPRGVDREVAGRLAARRLVLDQREVAGGRADLVHGDAVVAAVGAVDKAAVGMHANLGGGVARRGIRAAASRSSPAS